MLWLQWHLFLFQSTEHRFCKVFIIHVWLSVHSFAPFINIPANISLTEKSITQADGNRLGLCVVGQRSLAEFSSDT